ncbi:MAG: 30S ribosomal protein S6 [Ignavibacteriales bacterium]|nr:30S ribosomal protein S6 [Ignavibacteriales bacterium]MCF8317061.1 30S ribosomal protein S6 [Ignavibacteriales bacterium]MCF8438418.1 30S ribosomal protein S6 [Ignavibacteriales bacterium]
MKLKHYESVVIINAALEDDHVEATISRVKEAILTNGGEITEVDVWGRKRLAYPIQKAKSGYYLVLRYLAPSDIVVKVERLFSLDETVIRFITIALTQEALDYYKKAKEKAAAEAELAAEEQSKAESESEKGSEG